MRRAALLLVLALAGCDNAAGDVFTLYRSFAKYPGARYHVATFDAAQPSVYNSDNCQAAARLFLAAPGNHDRFWCEKGRYRA